VNVSRACGPHNRSVPSHNWAGCPLGVLLAVCCCMSAVSAQWLETSLDVPDSLCGGLTGPQILVYNRAKGLVYVGGSNKGCVIALSATTGEKKAKIVAGNDVRDMCFDGTGSKLYTADYAGGFVSVVDLSSNSLLTQINVGDNLEAICYNPVENKVYCGGHGTLAVIDAAADTLIRKLTVQVGERVRLCFNRRYNKVYRSCIGGLAIVDCSADSVIATPLGYQLNPGLCYDTLRDELYCASNSGDSSLFVIDGAGDTILRTIALPHHSGGWVLCHDTRYDRIYSLNATSNTVSIVDPAVGQVLATYPLPGGPWGPASMAYSPGLGRVYCAVTDVPDGYVTVLDCSMATVVKSLSVGRGAWAVCSDSQGYPVFCANAYDQSVTVIGTNDSVVGTVTLNGGPRVLTWAGTGNKVYCANEYSQNVTAINGETNAVLRSILVGGVPLSLCYNSADNKVYSGVDNKDSVKVLDVASDSVIATVALAGEPRGLCYSSVNNCIYCAVDVYNSDGYVAVIDGASNALVTQVPVGSMPWLVCFSPTSNKVYCANLGDNTISVVNCSTNAVVATVSVSGKPAALCLNSQYNKVYCTTPQYVAVIDGASNQIITTFSYGASPVNATALCFDSTEDKVYCSYYWYYDVMYCRVAIYDGHADTVIGTVTVPGAPSALYCNELNNKIYCANEGSGTGVVTLIDGTTNQVLGSIPVGDKPLGFGHNRRQNRIYVANYGSSTLSVLRDSGGGIEESFKPQAASTKPAPTVIRGVLFLPGASNCKLQAARLLDISGRKVLDLRPGANDVRALAPGVYFVREAQPQVQATQKVVITR
jgi:YVTN family beta-propeller protein